MDKKEGGSAGVARTVAVGSAGVCVPEGKRHKIQPHTTNRINTSPAPFFIQRPFTGSNLAVHPAVAALVLTHFGKATPCVVSYPEALEFQQHV